jgi:phospholipid transport system substrate-binding protein
MGRSYRQATPEQKTRLAQEFKSLLIRTYSSALNQYRDQKLDYKPLRADPNATEVTVRTEVIRPGQQPVQIDYSMEKTPSGWKAYDVIVGGVSLVTNYRDEFTREVQAGGIDGLIRTLAAKNSAPPVK